MKIEVLGSGGAIKTPRPFCKCECCNEAREGALTASRLGPSVFVHGPNILIDTPEEISIQLNRSKAPGVNLCLYSHWHPDHTSGKRIFEMNMDLIGLPPNNTKTSVVLTERIAETFSEFLGLRGHFDFLQAQGLVELKIVPNDDLIHIAGYTIRPVQMGMDYSFGYEIQGDGKLILIIMDELKGWLPPKRVLDTLYDVVYMPLGIINVNPLTKIRNIQENHPILIDEQTVDETLAHVKKLVPHT
ncbi:MAG: hypothetical protein ACOYL3_23290 [Desulfuromonadaceae bacterium]